MMYLLLREAVASGAIQPRAYRQSISEPSHHAQGPAASYLYAIYTRDESVRLGVPDRDT